MNFRDVRTLKASISSSPTLWTTVPEAFGNASFILLLFEWLCSATAKTALNFSPVIEN
jgi:hypothetical protein